MAAEKVLTALVYCLMSDCETPRSKSTVHECSRPNSAPRRTACRASPACRAECCFRATKAVRYSLSTPFPEVLDALHVVAFHGWHGVGTHQRELEQRQQAHLLVAAVVARDAVEAAAREFAVERQQAVETLRRVGVDRVGAVAQARAVFRDFLLGRVAVFLARPAGRAAVRADGRGRYRRWRSRDRA